MKKNLKKKLSFNKITVADLSRVQKENLRGKGVTDDIEACNASLGDWTWCQPECTDPGACIPKI